MKRVPKKKRMNNQLERKLSLFPLLNIVVANMIGAGIFTTSGLLMGNLHHPVIMLSLWIIGGIVALCGALSYGELGSVYPQAGGEYAFLTHIYHPLMGFLTGWTSLIAGFSAPIAASSIGIGKYLSRAFEFSAVTSTSPLLSTTALQKILSILLIVLFTAIHARGIKFGSLVQNILTILKIALIAGLIVAGFAFGKGDWGHFVNGNDFAFDIAGFKNIGLSLMWIMFAYSGWNAATYVGAEIRNPKKNLPLSLLLGTGLVTFFYFLLNLFFIYAVKPHDMYGVVSIGGLAVARAFGNSWESVLSVFIAFALFSSLSAFIILGPRVYYAMARDGVFFKSLAKVHPTHHVPSRSIVLQAVIACTMVMTGTFDQILTFMGFALGVFPIFAVFGVFRLRHKNRTRLNLSGHPIAPFVYIVISSMILILAFLQRPIESGLAIFTVLVGIPVYFAFRRANRV